jgi:hypothetical protein
MHARFDDERFSVMNRLGDEPPDAEKTHPCLALLAQLLVSNRVRIATRQRWRNPFAESSKSTRPNSSPTNYLVEEAD